MQLPPHVRDQVDDFLEGLPLSGLKRAAAALSANYRAGGATASAPIGERERCAAYLATRLPATYAACHHTMRQLAGALGEQEIESVLDIGAGCAAASLAAEDVFPSLRRFTLIEPDRSMAAAALCFLPDAQVLERRAEDVPSLPAGDLVVLSYVAGELGEAAALSLVERAWEAARVALLLIEPGSPQGFARVLAARSALIERGAHIAAPCPGATPCPMPADDWCHFAERVERSAAHRRLKDGGLSYEDEKFSYVAATRQPVPSCSARIIRRPEHHPGWIALQLCEGERTSETRVSRRHKAAFRRARKSRWGDAWIVEAAEDE